MDRALQSLLWMRLFQGVHPFKTVWVNIVRDKSSPGPKARGLQCTNLRSSYSAAFGGSLRSVQARNETPRLEKGGMMGVMLFFRSRVPVCDSFDVLRFLCRAMWMLRSMQSGHA
jgi:hypothetical protein